MNLFFDIETIPADEQSKKAAIEVTQKKLEKTYYARPKLSKKSEEDIFAQTSLSGDFGRVFCIGYALGESNVEIIKGEEREILNKWWKVADRGDCFIGHNIMEFDLRFIYKRSIVHKIKPAAKHLNLSFARYRNFPIYDTMREWEKWSNSFISLDTLAKILDLPSSKDGIDGSQVYARYLAKKYEDIYEYCKRDVELIRQVYKRMNFQQ